MSRRRPDDHAPTEPQDAAATESERARILAEVRRLSRDPMRETLAMLLACAPTPEEIRAAARKSPDRWGQLVAIFARASGYSERLEVEGDIGFTVKHLSDSELRDRLVAAEARLRALDAQQALPETTTSPDTDGPWAPRRAPTEQGETS